MNDQSLNVDYPVCLRLAGKRVLMVGGGLVATQRVIQLLAAGAKVRVVSPTVDPSLLELKSNLNLSFALRPYQLGDVQMSELVFSATDDKSVSEAVAQEARERSILVNTADVPELCDFTLPSVGRQGPIVLAISTSGLAPSVARLLRVSLSRRISLRHVHLARLVAFLKKHIPSGPSRMRFLSGLVEGDFGQRLLAGNRRAAMAQLRAQLTKGSA